MIKKILFLFFVVFAATAYSQDVTITGTVTSATRVMPTVSWRMVLTSV